MVSIISGTKGKGKTKELLGQVNAAVAVAHGSVVYLDKSAKHMYELNNKVRLVNVTEYPISDSNAFIGFICGILSLDSDIEKIYIDSFLKVADVAGDKITEVVNTLDELSKQFGVAFILSVSMNEADLPDSVKQYITISL
ncbi:MAG: twitching motility protein PilT [Lachnospiraceae bacterium]|nr:twitching motility protein PilT [Lachnospiraceae bacterium]